MRKRSIPRRRRTPSALLSLALLGSSAVCAVGCETIADVDFESAKARVSLGDASVPDGFVGAIPNGSGASSGGPDATTGPCAADEKSCNGACVKKSDPLFGCAATACAPCSLPNATKAKCDAAGACVVDTCAPSRGDCNGQASDGCEADLTSAATCGACNVACGAPTPLCSPGGCAPSCPGGTTQCGSTCVDTSSTPTHCGGCNQPCAAVANGSATCLAGKCGVACNSGYSDCDGKPGNGCEALGAFYQDADGDGVGGSTVTKACTAPAGYVSAGGDCHDGNPDVHPGQQTYFGTPYTSTAGQPSFDYDCNGTADENPAAVKLTDCGPNCNAAGYSAGGGGTYCGSTAYYQCAVYTACPDVCYTNPVPECAYACVPACGGYAGTPSGPFGCR